MSKLSVIQLPPDHDGRCLPQTSLKGVATLSYCEIPHLTSILSSKVRRKTMIFLTSDCRIYG